MKPALAEENDLMRARWATFAALALVFGFYLFTQAPWSLWISGSVALLTSALLTAVLEFWLRLSLRRAAQSQNALQEKQALQAARDLAMRLQRRFLQARTEKEILEALLEAGAHFLRAEGASFVPYDEWGQSLPAVFHGKIPNSAVDSWALRLTSPATRQGCKTCQTMHGGEGCVLIPPSEGGKTCVRCFSLLSEQKQIGVANFYFAQKTISLSPEDSAFMQEAFGAAGLALQNLRARDQEISALLYLQAAGSPKAGLANLLASLLENLQKALDVDFALFYLPYGLPQEAGAHPARVIAARAARLGKAGGEIPDQAFLEGIWQTVLTTGHSLSLENVTLSKREMWKMLFSVPLLWQEQRPEGLLVLGSASAQGLAQRHQNLLETIAGQAALLLQNSRLILQVEYQAVVDERARLAREIHDGLAQTLAFLKIQTAQMQNYLTRTETERLSRTLQAHYRTLSDAYIDARQAIDNLRRTPSAHLREWVLQIVTDYEQASEIKVDVSGFALQDVQYPPNVQAQLIRILQEALSNIRKHAQANQAWLRGRLDSDSVLIEICDNGKGFTPEDVDGNSRYGLRGMRERAESIGADFQIISKPGDGTVVSLRLPAALKEEV